MPVAVTVMACSFGWEMRRADPRPARRRHRSGRGWFRRWTALRMVDRGRVHPTGRRDGYEVQPVGSVQIARRRAGHTRMAVLPDDPVRTRVDDHDPVVVV